MIPVLPPPHDHDGRYITIGRYRYTHADNLNNQFTSCLEFTDTGFGRNSSNIVQDGYQYRQVFLYKRYNGDHGGLAMYSVGQKNNLSVLDIFVGDDGNDYITTTQVHYNTPNSIYRQNILMNQGGAPEFNYGMYLKGTFYRNGTAVATSTLSKSSIANADENMTWIS